MLVQVKDGKAAYARWKHMRPVKAVAMFKSGADTLQIAHNFAVKEATILRWITAERCERLNLPNPYNQA